MINPISSAREIHPLAVEPPMLEGLLELDPTVHALELDKAHEWLLLGELIYLVILNNFLNELII